MLGAVIGDLGAWTYLNENSLFYSQLVAGKSCGPELSPYGHAILRAASKNVYLDTRVDAGPISRPEDGIVHKGEWLMWQIVAAWCDKEQPNEMPQFWDLDKEESYAKHFIHGLINELRNGATKSEAYHRVCSFEDLSKTWHWRDVYDNGKKIEHGLLTYIFRAWNAFYLGFDFTSTIHNAVKWPDDKALTCAIAGAFASAFYGSRYNLIKKKYAKDGEFCKTFHIDNIIARCGYNEQLCAKIERFSDWTRAFIPKNNARTNVERHRWTDLVCIDYIEFTEKEKSAIYHSEYCCLGDDQFDLYKDGDWFYVCKGGVIYGRFQMKVKAENGLWLIVKCQVSDECPEPGFFAGLNSALRQQCHINSEKLSKLVEDLSHLRYYKGEDVNPHKDRQSSIGKFWFQEQVFCGNSLDRWLEAVKELRPDMQRKHFDIVWDWTEEQLAVWNFIYCNWSSWCPYDDLEWTFEYIPPVPFDKSKQRNTKKNLLLADACAKQNDKDYAEYIGKSGDYLVYVPKYETDVELPEGLPQLILVKNGIARYICGELSFSILENLKEYTKRGIM